MFLLAEVADNAIGAAIATIVLALGSLGLKIYKSQHDVRRVDANDIIRRYQEHSDRNDTRYSEQLKHLEERIIEQEGKIETMAKVHESELRAIYAREMECNRKYDRLFLITTTYGHALKAAGIAVPPIPAALDVDPMVFGHKEEGDDRVPTI